VSGQDELVPVMELLVDTGGLDGRQAKHLCLLGHVVQKRSFFRVKGEGNPEHLLDLGDCPCVIEMSVGVVDPFDLQVQGAGCTDESLGLVARIDEDAFQGFIVPDEKAVLLERADNEGLVLEGHALLLNQKRREGSRATRGEGRSLSTLSSII
jgi:hypothetical protein